MSSTCSYPVELWIWICTRDPQPTTIQQQYTMPFESQPVLTIQLLHLLFQSVYMYHTTRVVLSISFPPHDGHRHAPLWISLFQQYHVQSNCRVLIRFNRPMEIDRLNLLTTSRVLTWFCFMSGMVSPTINRSEDSVAPASVDESSNMSQTWWSCKASIELLAWTSITRHSRNNCVFSTPRISKRKK